MISGMHHGFLTLYQIVSSAVGKPAGRLTLNVNQNQGLVRIDVGEMLESINSGSLLVCVSWVFKCPRILPKLNVSSLPFKKPGDGGHDPIGDTDLAAFFVRQFCIARFCKA